MKVNPVLWRLVSSKRVQVPVDVVLLGFAVFGTIARPFHDSIQEALEQVLTQGGLKILVMGLIVVGVLAGLVKMLMLGLSAFPRSRVLPTPTEAAAQCVANYLNEYRDLHRKLESNGQLRASMFEGAGTLTRNIAYIVESMAAHLLLSLSEAGRRDIFASVYLLRSDRKGAQVLEYVFHYPSSKDGINSRQIALDDPKFAQYECVKLIGQSSVTVAMSDCSGYHRSSPKRQKRITQYIGIKLLLGDELVGFLNIEFNNKRFFASEEEMYEYIESNLLCFKYLIELQLLHERSMAVISERLA